MVTGNLLRPPGHRGPVIAAGAVLLSAGVALVELRFDDTWEPGTHFLLLALVAGLVLFLGLQYRTEGGAPLASASVMIVAGLLLSLFALLRLAQLAVGDGEEVGAGSYALVAAAFSAGAAWPATRRHSAAAALLSALGAVAFVLFAQEKLFDPDTARLARWLLLALAVGFVLASLVLRGGRPRHATQLVDVAGLCLLGICATGAGDSLLSVFGLFFGGLGSPPGLAWFWDGVVFAGVCGLLAAGAVDREPGPVLVGLATLVLWLLVVAGDEATLRWWPFLLLAAGGGLLAVGLRPRAELPPEPGYAGPLPLAARTERGEGDELTIRVRNED